MFINNSDLFGVLDLYRLVWLGGRFGGHKTSLAFRMAQDFLERGYRLVSNTRCVWSDNIEDLQLDEKTGHLHAVIILDEGGLEFKSSRQIEELAAYAAKMDIVFLIPSFWPPVRQARVVTVQPVFNFKSTGIPLVIYKWSVRLGDFTDKGWFGWYKPSEIYGIYSRQDPGARTARIVQVLLERKDEYRRRFGYVDDDLSTVEEVTDTDVLRDAATAISEAADAFTSLPVRRNKRR